MMPLSAASAGIRLIGDVLSGLGQEISELGRPGKRSRLCLMSALSVALSVTAALALHLDNPWWSGISGFMSIQLSRPGSIKRGTLRVIGTVAGATVGALLTPWLAYDHAACALILLLLTTVGVLGVMVSPHGYAFLFAGITSAMVLFMSLNNPPAALNVAVYRTGEVTLGTMAALLVASLLGTEEDAGSIVPSPSGWRDLLGSNWPAVQHGLRSGVAVAVLPFLWDWLELQDVSQMAVTVAAVMAVPSLSGTAANDGRQIFARGLQRLLGCLLGGLAGLAVLALSITEFLPWLAMLTAGVWVGTHVQASERGVGYAGIQGTVVFIMTLVQGNGPPASMMPAIDRFVGIGCGLTLLLVISLLLWPSADQPQAA